MPQYYRIEGTRVEIYSPTTRPVEEIIVEIRTPRRKRDND